MDKEGIEGIHPDDAELLEEETKICVSQRAISALAFKIATTHRGRLASVLIQDV
jgi:elongation factor G